MDPEAIPTEATVRRLIFVVLLAIVFAVVRNNGGGVSDVAHDAVRLHLTLTASSIYEYQALQGRWPTKCDDLTRTSLPAASPYWRYELDEGLIVIVWHQDLKPKPADNADRILAYYAKGTISEGGRQWVCWGDLRTDYVETDVLHAYLARLKK